MRIQAYTTRFGLSPAVVLGLFLLILLRIPSFAEPHWYGDEGIYASIAGEMRHGEALYRDIWDNKPPFIYWLYLLAGGDSSMFGIRLLNLLAGMAAAIGIYQLARQLTTAQSALGSFFIAVVLLGTPVLEGNIANSENFLLPLVVWGLYLGLTNRGSLRKQLLSGALFGLACLFKLVAVLDFTGFMVFIVLARTRLIRDDLEHEKVETPWPFVAGFLVPLLTVSFSMILHGTFGSFMTATLLDMFHYMGHSGDYWLGLVLWPMAGTATLLLFILGTILIGMNFASGRIHEREMFVSVLFWFEYVAVLLSGRHYSHYLIQLVPGVSLLVVMGIQRVAKSTSLIDKMNAGTVLICALYLALITFSHGQPIGAYYDRSDAQGKLVAGTVRAYYANYITHVVLGTRSEAAYQRFFNDEQSRIDLLGKTLSTTFSDIPRDAIYLYTDQGWGYPHLGLRVPTPFSVAYHRHLAMNGTARLIGSLEANQPQLIVLDQTLAVFPELARFIARSYRPVANDAAYHYFVKTESPMQSEGLRGSSPAGDAPRNAGLISTL
jgi:hypothetical protein